MESLKKHSLSCDCFMQNVTCRELHGCFHTLSAPFFGRRGTAIDDEDSGFLLGIGVVLLWTAARYAASLIMMAAEA